MRENHRVLTLALLGPTASGKSSLAIETALHLGAQGRPAEVVNADSMLVYRGMDIGTAKPGPAERRGVAHHLIDIMEVTETATVAQFQQLARATIADCHRRRVIPILTGGSALYLRAILDDFTFPGTDPQLRAQLEQELAHRGPYPLHQRLAQLAPDTARQILPGNGRRIVRALEVVELTGSYQPRLPAYHYVLDSVVAFGLRIDRAEMDRRIDSRVDAMWQAGLVDEVRRLVRVGLRQGRTASRGLGYAQVLEYLDQTVTEDQARQLTKAGTRRFARKQLGWWRRDPRITWLDASTQPSSETIVSQIGQREADRP